MGFRTTVVLGGKTATGLPVPDDLAALAGEPAAGQLFAGPALTYRKEWVWWVTETTRAETRAQRVGRTVEALRAGRRSR